MSLWVTVALVRKITLFCSSMIYYLSGKHRKHAGGRGNAGGQHHHRTLMDKLYVFPSFVVWSFVAYGRIAILVTSVRLVCALCITTSTPTSPPPSTSTSCGLWLVRMSASSSPPLTQRTPTPQPPSSMSLALYVHCGHLCSSLLFTLVCAGLLQGVGQGCSPPAAHYCEGQVLLEEGRAEDQGGRWCLRSLCIN